MPTNVQLLTSLPLILPVDDVKPSSREYVDGPLIFTQNVFQKQVVDFEISNSVLTNNAKSNKDYSNCFFKNVWLFKNVW